MKISDTKSIASYVGRRTATLLEELREECQYISKLLAQLELPSLHDEQAEADKRFKGGRPVCRRPILSHKCGLCKLGRAAGPCGDLRQELSGGKRVYATPQQPGKPRKWPAPIPTAWRLFRL